MQDKISSYRMIRSTLLKMEPKKRKKKIPGYSSNKSVAQFIPETNKPSSGTVACCSASFNIIQKMLLLTGRISNN